MRRSWTGLQSAARRRLIGRAALAFVLVLGPLAGLPTTNSAYAARNLPKDARFGKLTEFVHPYAKIGGKVLHMSPGAKIYNEQNLIIQPAAMQAPAKVLFRLDNAGQLSAIWILTAQEAAVYDRGSFTTKPPQATNPAPKATNPAAQATNPTLQGTNPVPPAQAPAADRLGGRQ